MYLCTGDVTCEVAAADHGRVYLPAQLMPTTAAALRTRNSFYDYHRNLLFFVQLSHGQPNDCANGNKNALGRLFGGN
jgi:hypothetical protein